MAGITIGEKSGQISLCETLDRVLNKGAVIVGEVTISVANIDLVYLALQVVLTSVETSRKMMQSQCNESVAERMPENERD
jgi:gas vesicle structural protein